MIAKILKHFVFYIMIYLLDIKVQLKKLNKIKKIIIFLFFLILEKLDYLVRIWTNKKNIKNIPKYISKNTSKNY